MRKPLSGLFILCLLLILSHTAQARGYEIEMIVFEQARGNADADAAEDEKWDFSDRKIADSLQRMTTLEARSDAFRTGTVLGQLEQTRHRLIQAGHRILRTVRWVQPSAVYQHAPLISLGLAETSLAHGFIRVYKTSLIYADLDLQFSPESPANPVLPGLSPDLSTPAATGTQTDSLSSALPDNLPEHYFLSEKRRLKFREVHYFDHPKFGALLSIWPTSG